MKKDIRSSFSDRKFKMGGYQTLIMVIVIVVVVVLNLIVGKMNITVDLSSDKIYTLTEDTKNLAQGLQDEITLYYMCQDGNETTQIEKVLDEYKKLSHITVETKDPVQYPNFSKNYTEDEIAENDVIVVNEKSGSAKHVTASSMIVSDIDYTTYSQTNSLDVEGQITSAIQSVTSAKTRTVYATGGHGEQQIDSAFSDILTKSNITTQTLETANEKSVPEDCSILLINGPQYDFTEKETELLSTYLQDGGKAMIFLNPASDEQPNLYKLLKDYGVNAIEGYLLEPSTTLEQNTTVVMPSAEEHDITADVGDLLVYAPVTVGMTGESDVRSTLTVESLLKTTEETFCKVNKKSAVAEKEENDVDGPFSVAMAVTDTYPEKTKGSGNATKLVVYGSYNFQASDFTKNNQTGNRSMLLNSITWLTGSETSTLAIPTRSLDMEMVTMEKESQIFWTACLVVVLPLSLLAAGFVIWYKRRKR